MEVLGRGMRPGEEGDEVNARFNMEARQAFMRPELLNRIDEIVVFHQLRKENLGRIADIQLARLHKRLAEREITLELSPAAREQIAAEGWDPAYGARPLKRTIQQRIENPLATRILNGEFGPGDRIVADYQGKSFVFDRAGGGRPG
jgi:ATP-dependent Clp protease ATP-binding subunit ClpB